MGGPLDPWTGRTAFDCCSIAKAELKLPALLSPLNMKPIRAALAQGQVNSNDPFLFHKTTRREVYDLALKAHPACDDVLLHNERGELTEFTIGNLVVELGGELVTPPVVCGLLAGTFRAELLETGKVMERVVPSIV